MFYPGYLWEMLSKIRVSVYIHIHVMPVPLVDN